MFPKKDTYQIIRKACYDFRKEWVDYLILTFSHWKRLRI